MVAQEKGRVLLFRKARHTSHAGKWEFPGGKVQEGETPQEALIREIREELSVEVDIDSNFPPLQSTSNQSIELIPFRVRLPKEYSLSDHDRVAWVSAEEESKYDILPLDLPIFKEALSKDSL